MAKAKRASARGKRVRAKPKAKPHANSSTKPLPRSLARPHGNRLVFSPELIADGKRRYETTEESLDSIALDFSSNRSTLRNIAKRENWKRYVPPPLGLSRAAEIAAKAEALEAEALNDRHPEVLAEGEPRRIDARAVALRGSLTLAPQGDGEGAGRGDEAVAPATAPGKAWSMRERIDELRNAVDEEIAAVRALRAKLKSVPHSTQNAGRTSRTLADLTTTLERLHRLEIGVPQHEGQNAYDIPADLDEFRDELARRIRAFVASRAGAPDADGSSGPAAMDQVR